MSRSTFRTSRRSARRFKSRRRRRSPVVRNWILVAVVALVVAALIVVVIARPWSTEETNTLDDIAATAERLEVEDTVTVEFTTEAGRFEGTLDPDDRLMGTFTTDSDEPVSAQVVSSGNDVFAEGGEPLWQAAGFTGDFAGWARINDAGLMPARLDPTLDQIAHAARTQDATVNDAGAASLRGFVVQVVDNGEDTGKPHLKVSRGTVRTVITGGGSTLGDVDDALEAANASPGRVVDAGDGVLRVEGRED